VHTAGIWVIAFTHVKVPKQAHKVNTKAQSNVTTKTAEEAFVHKIAQSGNESLIEKQPDMPSTHCGEEEDIEPVSNVASQKYIDNMFQWWKEI